MLACAAALAQGALPYLDPKLPVDQRVADLLSRMTLEEKVAADGRRLGEPRSDHRSEWTLR